MVKIKMYILITDIQWYFIIIYRHMTENKNATKFTSLADFEILASTTDIIDDSPISHASEKKSWIYFKKDKLKFYKITILRLNAAMD